MVYEIFVRKKKGVINEYTNNPKVAMKRFAELSKKYKEVNLEKRRKSWRTAGKIIK